MTGADPLSLCTHVRRARRSSVLSCRHSVHPGAIIAKRGGRWICLQCALEAIRASRKAATP